jgi:hypothetical protein
MVKRPFSLPMPVVAFLPTSSQLEAHFLMHPSCVLWECIFLAGGINSGDRYIRKACGIKDATQKNQALTFCRVVFIYLFVKCKMNLL